MENHNLIYPFFLVTCIFCSDTEIFDILIDHFAIDINYIAYKGDSYFMYACKWSKNLHVIKHLKEHYKVDIDQINKLGNCYMIDNFFANSNLEIVKYLIEETDIQLQLYYVSFDRWRKIVSMLTHNYQRFNKVLTGGFEKFLHYEVDHDFFNKPVGYSAVLVQFIKELNPLLLPPDVRTKCSIKDSFDDDFSNFIKYVDGPSFCTPIPKMNEINSNQDQDFTELPELLFRYNGDKFYGYKNAIYKNRLNLMKVLPDDLSNFLSHIDQIEYDLINYLEINGGNIDCEYLTILAVKYKLKLLYLYLNNMKK